MGAVPLSALGAPTLDPTLAALTLPGANLNSQVGFPFSPLNYVTLLYPACHHVLPLKFVGLKNALKIAYVYIFKPQALSDGA